MGIDLSNAKGTPMALLVLFAIVVALMVGISLSFRGAVML